MPARHRADSTLMQGAIGGTRGPSYVTSNKSAGFSDGYGKGRYMGKTPEQRERFSFTRREVLVGGLKTMVVSCALPAISAKAFETSGSWRAINIMNFIRAEEPRESTDLIKPAREQMALIKVHKFPATWLLQYDALVEGPYVEFLKAEMPPDHETGIWFEMNRKICDDAGIAWRGKPEWEWDYHVPIAYAIGYTPDERRKLADTAMMTFKRIFGRDAKTVASWNLDAVSIAHLSDHYGIDAFGNCRDQLATDGFTIWGAPIAAYYPNRMNAWSPALEAKNQISTPMFRLLGQDPFITTTIRFVIQTRWSLYGRRGSQKPLSIDSST